MNAAYGVEVLAAHGVGNAAEVDELVVRPVEAVQPVLGPDPERPRGIFPEGDRPSCSPGCRPCPGWSGNGRISSAVGSNFSIPVSPVPIQMIPERSSTMAKICFRLRRLASKMACWGAAVVPAPVLQADQPLLGADPQQTVPVFADDVDRVVQMHAGLGSQAAGAGKIPGPAIEAVQAFFGADQSVPCLSSMNAVDKVIAQAGRIGRIVAVMDVFPGLAVEAVDAAADRWRSRACPRGPRRYHGYGRCSRAGRRPADSG